MTDEELDEALAELEPTCAMAERELETLKSRREHLESLERDKEALLENYAALAVEISARSYSKSVNNSIRGSG